MKLITYIILVVSIFVFGAMLLVFLTPHSHCFPALDETGRQVEVCVRGG